MLFFNLAMAQIRWTGAGGNNQWSDSTNWENSKLPENGDYIILDHQFISEDYSVIFPSGNYTINLSSLLIDPTSGKSITFIIPIENTSSPAIICTESPGIVIKKSAVLINNSGASSGETISVSGGLRIETGGRYVHRTRRPHAGLVGSLIHDELTEKGIFEFSVPYASNTISMSGRSYGSLKLSAVGEADTVIYTAAGTGGALIRGDLILSEKVSLKMNLSDTLHVAGDFVQEGGVFDLSTTARSLKLNIKGNFLQNNGEITTTGSVHSEIILSGSEEQKLEVKGKLSNRVFLLLNNENGIRNDAPLYLPDSLILIKGIIHTSKDHPVILSANSWIKFDSLNESSFIQGFIIKENLSANQTLNLPLGDRGLLRWMGVKEAEGNIEFGYQAKNPRLISSDYHTIHHISSLEYWTIKPENDFSVKISLSFTNGHQSGVTEMESLTIAQLSGGIWNDAGKVSYTGSPGAAGTVTSQTIHISGQQEEKLITLAALSASQNPLPVKFFGFQSIQEGNKLITFWNSQISNDEEEFRIEIFNMNHQLIKEETIPANKEIIKYSWQGITAGFGKKFYLKIYLISAYKKDLLLVKAFENNFRYENLKITRASAKGGKFSIEIISPVTQNSKIVIINQLGKIVTVQPVNLHAGKNIISIENIYLRLGLYYIFAITSELRSNTISTYTY